MINQNGSKVSQTMHFPAEHRLEKRTPAACPVYVHGIAANGTRIKIHTLTDNISQGGLFLHIPNALELGCHVFTFTRLPSGAGLAALGKVVRIEKKAQGLAVCFHHLRLIPAKI